MAESRKKKTTKRKKEKKTQPYKELKKTAEKKGKDVFKHPSKYKTIDDILKEQAKEFNMKGDEILNTDQMKILLTQMALGNLKDGYGMKPSIQERQQAIKQLTDMTKSDINGDAVEEHNESIKEFELKNDGTAPNRSLGDFE